MAGSTLRDSQMAMARFLRDPDTEPPPAGVEARRLQIYQDLIYNNIEGFISGGFPVLHSLYDADDWRGLVRAFMQEHRCRSPYFLEISQEFIQFLLEDHQPRPCDPPFAAELAHYEWVELALDVSRDTLPEQAPVEDLASAVPKLSPLAWSLAYSWPVHRIGRDSRPDAPGDPVYLVVYRDREDQVRFLEANPATARLLELVRDNETATIDELLAALAEEMGTTLEAIRAFGLEQFARFVDQSVVLVTEAGGGA